MTASYEVRDGIGELWYRSLRDGTIRRVEGTTGGWQPAVSPDGKRVLLNIKDGEHTDMWSYDIARDILARFTNDGGSFCATWKAARTFSASISSRSAARDGTG